MAQGTADTGPDIVQPVRFKTPLQLTMVLAISAMALAACSFSIGVTNSPPVPSAGSAPSTDRR